MERYRATEFHDGVQQVIEIQHEFGGGAARTEAGLMAQQRRQVGRIRRPRGHDASAGRAPRRMSEEPPHGLFYVLWETRLRE